MQTLWLVALVLCVSLATAVPWDALEADAVARSAAISRKMLGPVIAQCRSLEPNIESAVRELTLPAGFSLRQALEILTEEGQPYLLVLNSSHDHSVVHVREPLAFASEIARSDWLGVFRLRSGDERGCPLAIDGHPFWAPRCNPTHRALLLLKQVPLRSLARWARADAVARLRALGPECETAIQNLARPWIEAAQNPPAPLALHTLAASLDLTVVWGRPPPSVPLLWTNTSSVADLLKFVLHTELAQLTLGV
jgi:hypothetical protein